MDEGADSAVQQGAQPAAVESKTPGVDIVAGGSAVTNGSSAQLAMNASSSNTSNSVNAQLAQKSSSQRKPRKRKQTPNMSLSQQQRSLVDAAGDTGEATDSAESKQEQRDPDYQPKDADSGERAPKMQRTSEYPTSQAVLWPAADLNALLLSLRLFCKAPEEIGKLKVSPFQNHGLLTLGQCAEKAYLMVMHAAQDELLDEKRAQLLGPGTLAAWRSAGPEDAEPVKAQFRQLCKHWDMSFQQSPPDETHPLPPCPVEGLSQQAWEVAGWCAGTDQAVLSTTNINNDTVIYRPQQLTKSRGLEIADRHNQKAQQENRLAAMDCAVMEKIAGNAVQYGIESLDKALGVRTGYPNIETKYHSNREVLEAAHCEDLDKDEAVLKAEKLTVGQLPKVDPLLLKLAGFPVGDAVRLWDLTETFSNK